MAFVIPAVVSFVAAGGTAAAVGAALTGAAGFATFATVAGGFIASAGMLTKNKTLTKIGSIMGLAGGLANLASSAMDKLGEAAVNSAADDALAASAADKVAKDAVTDSLVSEMASKPVGSLGAEVAQQAGGVQPLALSAHEAAATGLPQNLMDQARALQMPAATSQAAQPGVSQALVDAGKQIKDSSSLTKIVEGAKQTAGGGSLTKIVEGAKQTAGGVGKFLKENKELALIGGQVLAGGMQSAERANEFDQKMNLMEQRRRRMNQVVQMGVPSVGLANPAARLPVITRGA
jgi:hypothetical protein